MMKKAKPVEIDTEFLPDNQKDIYIIFGLRIY